MREIAKRSFFGIPVLSLLPLFCLVLASTAYAQDPTGRPTGSSSSSKKHKPKSKTPVTPEKVTVLLTVVTDPPGCQVFLNGEEKGVSDDEGKLKIDKLDLGNYTVEARKDGYMPEKKPFQAGEGTPTLVFKLTVSLDEQTQQFDQLVVGGKLAPPASPNAFDLVQDLAAKYPDRTEVEKIRGILVQKLTQNAKQVAEDTDRWRRVKRPELEQGLIYASSATKLKADDKAAQWLEAYLAASLALRDWETGKSPEAPETGEKLLATAKAGFEKAANLNVKWALIWYQLGRTRLFSNDWSGAETAFDRSIQLDAGSIEAHLGLADAYRGQGKYKEAIAECQKIIALDSNNSGAYACMGLARAESGKAKDGIKEIERAAQLKPDSGIPHLNLAIYYSKSKKKKDRDTAAAELQTAMQKNSDGLEFPNRIAESLAASLKSDEGDKKN